MLEGLWMFTLLCLFYFFFRINQFEKVLLTQINKQKKINQQVQDALTKLGGGSEPSESKEKREEENKQ